MSEKEQPTDGLAALAATGLTMEQFAEIVRAKAGTGETWAEISARIEERP